MIFQKTCAICGLMYTPAMLSQLGKRGDTVRQEEIRNRKKRQADKHRQRTISASLPKPEKQLEQSTIIVDGKEMTLYKCAMMDMRATTLPCGFRDDCFRLHCPHIPRAV